MKEKDIGALWVKEGQHGKYMSGSVEINGEKIRIVVFKNNYKQEDKYPDYRIYRAKSQQQAQGGAQEPVKGFADDIPF